MQPKKAVFSNRSIDRGAAKVKLHDYIATDLCNCAGLAQYFEHTTEIINLMKGHGCVNIHIEETKDKERIEWCKFIDSLSNGDSAVFASFDNVFHNFNDMMFFIKYCSKMDIRIISLSDELDTHDRLFPERRTADTLDLINQGGEAT